MYMYNGSHSFYATVVFHNKMCFDRGYISFVYSWQHRYEWGWKINVELPKYVIVAEKNIFLHALLLHSCFKGHIAKIKYRSFWSAHSRHKHLKYELKLKNNNYNYVQFLLN